MEIWLLLVGFVLVLVAVGTVFAIAFPGQWTLGLLEVTPVAIAVAIVGRKAWSDRRAAARTPAAAAVAGSRPDGEPPHA